MAIRTVCMAALALACLVEGPALAAQTARMQAMPPTDATARPMMQAQRPTDEEAATNAAIDSRLARFAAANANDPSVQDALDGAATELRGHPETYIGAGGSVDRSAMSELLQRHFDRTGTVILPSAAVPGPDNYANLGNMGDGDIMALAFIVMMEAAKSESEDLKQIMARVKAINNAKAQQRKNLADAQTAQAAAGDHDPGGCVDAADCPDDPNAMTAVPAGGAKDIDNAKDTVKDKLDSLSEMGEMESLRLQMAMDRKSKLMSTLSNLLKKESDTSDSIIQNIK